MHLLARLLNYAEAQTALFQSISYICFLDMPRFSTFAPLGSALHKEMSIMLAEQGKTGIEKGFR